METLSLVIPAFNEEERLPALLDALAESAGAAVRAAGYELLESVIVDDGSDDGTATILADRAATQPGLAPVLGAGENRGKGAAIAAGVERARGSLVLLVDADLSTPLDELPKLAGALAAGADLAIGSRAVPGAIVERGPVHRKLLGWGFNGAVRALTGLPIRDTQCGFKLLPAEVARQLLTGLTCPGFAFDVELLMRAERAGLRIAEIPVTYVHDPRSRVEVVAASYRMLRDVGSIAYRYRLRRSSAPDPVPVRQSG